MSKINFDLLENHFEYHEIVDRLILDLESNDQYTSIHSIRVGDMSFSLAQKIGLRGSELEKVHIAAHLHDIGKMLIPPAILNKKGPLLPWEWELIKKHPVYGYHILKKTKKLNIFAELVLYHHERWDGNGYPAKLKGKEIPLGSRVISVCDTIDAMASARPYRKAFTVEETLQEIQRNKGIQFDPEILEAAETLWPVFKSQYVA